ncbi:MAG: hypothetical protein AB7D51_02505 [Desulfovibrionaceae bacterium]
MRTIFATIILTLALVPSAFADVYPFNIDTFETYLAGNGHGSGASYVEYTGDLSGSWDVTAIAFEAYDHNQFTDASGNVLFDTADTSTFGTWVQGVDLTTATWTSVTQDQSFSLLDPAYTTVYQLTDDWTVPGTDMTLAAGTLLIGFNDTGSPDSDRDDLILVATPSATPIPGAAWLLGSGLLGLVGLRRARANR